ncbi:MAG TPA: hypothetical protein VEA58_05565 [Anaerovoracaceae bacterium]|nr:hypothetical protein [Anaerovoracaceae bacterium]
MKRLVLLLSVLILAFGLTGCGGEDAGAEAAAGETGEERELILGENAFGVSFSVKKVSDESVVFIVEPFADKFGDGTNVFEMGEGLGIWGRDALVAGTKKGNEADLKGSFTIYADSKNGPSVTIDVDGTYGIDEEGYCETDDHMFYYLYQDGQFTVSDRETVMGF